jgi:hypothetical protein
MKKLRLLGVVPLLIGVSTMTLAGGQDRGGNAGLRERFVERGSWPGSKRKAQTGKFTGPTLPGCLSSRATATCLSRLWNATRSHKPPLSPGSIRKAGRVRGLLWRL